MQKRMQVLVIDIGGSHVKFMVSGGEERRKIDSGREFGPKQLLTAFREQTKDWKFGAISVGFPGPIVHGKPVTEPNNLGKGWIDFDFKKTLKKQTKVINDAAMQALGSYEGGRMLFLGLGTGLGSAMILDGVVVPLELGELRYSLTETLEERVSKHALKKHGQSKWEKAVHEVVEDLRRAFVTDYIVLGGGNAKKLKKLPDGARRGANENAFYGGLRLWGESPVAAELKKHTLVIT